jgi:CheY-like chemotaxis protein
MVQVGRPSPAEREGGLAHEIAPLRILLVEDNPDHVELIQRSLVEIKDAVELAVARDGEEAVSYLRHTGPFADPEKSPRPHLVLLDLRLPKLDGFHVLREMKESEELRAIPAVVLTTSEADPDIARAYSLHANSYLVKPVDFERFVKLMGDVEGYWLECNRRPEPDEPPPDAS